MVSLNAEIFKDVVVKVDIVDPKVPMTQNIFFGVMLVCIFLFFFWCVTLHGSLSNKLFERNITP